MLRRRWVLSAVISLSLTSAALAGDSLLVVDRGLPQSNLNNVSGAARSNVRWASGDSGFMGDHFSIGARGEKWIIDAIRTWVVPGDSVDPDHLGDFYQDVRLYLGQSGSDLTPTASASLSAGADETSNPNIVVSDATKNGTPLYDDFGTFLRVWQIDFNHLNLAVDGGAVYNFGVWGMGRETGKDGKAHMWFNYASNAPLSGAREDGADGIMLGFDGSGKAAGEFTSQGNGWDKNSNINVQVFAHRVGGVQLAAQ